MSTREWGKEEREQGSNAPIPRPNRTILHPSNLDQLRQIHPLPPQTRRKHNRRARDRDRIPTRQDPILDGFRARERAGALERDGEGEVVADAGDEGVEVRRGGAVGGGGVEEFVDLFESGGDFLRREQGEYDGENGRATRRCRREKGRREGKRTFFDTLVNATISLNVLGTLPCLHAIKMHAAMIAASLFPLKTFSSSTLLNNIFVVSIILFGNEIASHIVAISLKALWRSRPEPPCWSFATRAAAI